MVFESFLVFVKLITVSSKSALGYIGHCEPLLSPCNLIAAINGLVEEVRDAAGCRW